MSMLEYKKFVPEPAKFYVYIAGPIAKGDFDSNMQQAAKSFIMLVHSGLVPFVPHATSYLVRGFVPEEAREGLEVYSYDFWLKYDFSWIRDIADCIFRLPGESWGTEREEEFARSLNIPVFSTVGEVFDFAEKFGYPVDRKAAYKFGKEFDNAVYNGRGQETILSAE